MKLTRNQTIVLGAIGLIVLFFILIFSGIIPGLKKSGTGGLGTLNQGKETELNFWGISSPGNEESDKTAIQSLIDEYSKINKNVKINYRWFDDSSEYENALLNALATNQAPDIFMFHNDWLPKHYNKVAPAPKAVFSLNNLQQLFPTIVEQDLVSNGEIYGLPLYIDTLALLYNKDIFDAKAIALAPSDWQTFQSLIPYLREVNPLNQIIKPAAAIGGSEKSIDAASDLLNLLIMQFGSKMIDQDGKVNFGNEALNALNFYLSFANPASPYYTWNENLRYSLDNFSDGSTAMIFDYASRLPLIKAKNPYLNIGIGPMPQLPNASQPINYADYWALTVSNQSRNYNLAWDFIFFATTNPQIAENYLRITKRPPALRTLIAKYINDSELGVFSRQALTSRSWPQPDSSIVKKSFSNMVESVLSGRLSSKDALEEAQNEINSINQ